MKKTTLRNKVHKGFVSAVLVAGLFVGPVAYAQTISARIGDPYTDTLQLWSEIAASIEQVTQQVAATFQHPTQSQTAAVTPEEATQQSKTTSSTAAGETQTPSPTQTIVVATTTRTVIEYAPRRDTSVLSAKLESLITIVGNLASLIRTTQQTAPVPPLPQNVAADGNPDVPYAAESNISNLSNVTITNANITASEIPALDYLSLSGGSLAGNLILNGSATTTGTSYFSGNVGIGTSTSQDALAIDGSTFLANITAPSLTINRLYANGGSLYWAGSVIAGGATGNWASDGTNTWRTGGNVGIGTSSPFAALSVVGNGYLTGSLSAAAVTATNATSTNFFSTFGDFTTGLINTLSGTTLTYTAASTTNFSNSGTAYFGGSGTTTIDSSGDLTVGGSLRTSGNVTLGNATSTSFFAQTASLGSLSLSSPLSVASGGTGWTSIANGYIPFGNGGSALATSSLFYWDNTDGRLGIGTTTLS